MERDSRVPEVEILLSTYNGEKYLREQLDSIFCQTFQDFRVLVRDDGSRDETVSIIEEYSEKYPGKIIFFPEDRENLKPPRSFLKLLAMSKAQYIMFCDQDDYWLPEKIEKTFLKMREVEGKNKNFDGEPVLIHTDLKVVDSTLKEISNSFWKYQNINPNIKDYRRLTVENNVTGCTVMMNRTLANLVKGLEERGDLDSIIMHDWFITVVAAKMGVIEFLNEGTILYRQHGKNDTGAKRWSLTQNLRKLTKISELKSRIQKVMDQSRVVGEFLGDSELVVFSKTDEMKYWEKRRWIWNRGFVKSNIVKNLVYLSLV